MKKILAWILVATTVITSIGTIRLVEAAESTEPVATIAETEETTTEDGIYFYTQDHDYYYSDKTKAQEVFNQFPATIEVTIKTAQYRPGVIIGNNTQKAPATSTDATGTFSLGLYLGRLPYMYIDGNVYWFTIGDEADYATEATARTWHGADYIPSNKWIHLTIVNDVEANNGAGEMRCYINGSLKVTKEGAYTEDWVSNDLLCLGGNLLELGPERFKDYIKNVAIYSDVRSGDEITADATAMIADGAYTPDTTDTNANLMACYSLSTEVKTDGTRIYPQTLADLSNNGLTLYTHWLEESQKEDVQVRDDYDYSMAIIGDPQVVTHYSAQADLYPTGSHKDKAGAIDSLFAWIKENAESKNIKFAFNLGDTVNTSTNATTSATQWKLGSEALESLTGTVPWSVVRGNHDSIEGFIEHFSYEEHKNRISGSYDENMLNTYQKFQVGDIKYLVLNLDFGVGASYGTEYEGDTVDVDSTNERRMTDGSGNPDMVLAWANEVVKANPEYNVILTTHGYTEIDGTRLKNEHTSATSSPTCIKVGREGYYREYAGEDIYEKLVKDNSNIVLVLSGHIAAGSTDPIKQREVTREDGSTVVEMLVNPQYVDKKLGLTGLVAMLYFSDGGKTVQVEYYSTLRGRYFFAENQFTMNLNVIDSEVITGDNGSVFLSYSNVDRTGNIPVSAMEDYNDYLFAGWYTNAIDEEKYAIKNAEDITELCYAKFVPADILDTKVQVTNRIVTGETSEENVKYNGNYVIRFVSSVEGLNYRKVGFKVTAKDGSFEGESRSTKVFSNIKSSNKGSEYEFSPKVISEQSKYFITAKLPVASDSKNTDYIVQAYWDTYDGTRVYGESRCVSVNDNNTLVDESRENDVINVTVNGELEETGSYTASFTSSSVYGEEEIADDYSMTGTTVEILNVGEGYTNVRIKLPKDDIENIASLTKIEIDGTDYYGMYRNYNTTHASGDASAPDADTSWYYEAVALNPEENVFVIASSADLYGFATLVDNGTTFTGKTVIQVGDIKVNDGTAVKSAEATDGVAKWVPNKDDEGNDKLTYIWNSIGPASASSHKFNGTFDGDNNSISGLYTDSGNYNGLFATTGENSVIRNIKLVNSYLAGDNYMGVVGYAYGKEFSNIYSDAIHASSVSGTSHYGYIGGIVGRARTGEYLFQNCWFNGEISLGANSNYTGGIVGEFWGDNNAEMINCINTGCINSTASGATTKQVVGGLIGRDYQTKLILDMTNCMFAGTIKVVEESSYVASLIGHINKKDCVVTFADCYTIGNVTGVTTDNVVGTKNGAAKLTVTIDQATSSKTACKKTEAEIKSIIENKLSSDFTWISYVDNTETTVELPALKIFKEWWLQAQEE